jgi:hypothetical protein
MNAVEVVADPVWQELYDRQAREGEVFDFVLDVRPERARRARPYPAPCIAVFADDLLDDLGWLVVGYPPETCRICCVCWSGLRAVRVVHHLWHYCGWDAYWWALSPAARAAMN